MIKEPVFIVGAPRSGTSLLFHILRTSQPFWSLPSEGQHIWDTACHPSRRDWDSEECHFPDALSDTARKHVGLLYEQQSMPSWFWRRVVNPQRIWEYNPTSTRRVEGNVYLQLTRMLFWLNPVRHRVRRRLLDKTAVLIGRDGDGRQNTDDGHHDHQFNQGKTFLHGLHGKTPLFKLNKTQKKIFLARD
jgi:hypothetical protein